MEGPTKINISSLVDDSKLGLFQAGMFTLCGLCLVMDGFDVQAISYVAPAIIREWGVPAPVLGPVFGAGPLGILIGSLLFSVLADKIGRRSVLIGLTLYFSVITILTARAASVNQLLVLRLLAGTGLGGIMPNAMALVGEYSPLRTRAMLMMIVTNGFNLGAAFGGFVSAWLIPHFGWRSVFYFGGAAPLVIAVLMLFSLPESLQWMVLRGRNPDRVARWLKRINPAAQLGNATQYIVHEEQKEGLLFVHLFQNGRAAATILLWVVNFMNLANVFLLASWLPTVARAAGYSTSQAVLVGAALQVGSTIGTLVLSWFVYRLGFIPVLATGFLLACADIALIGQPGLPLALLFVVVFIAGFFVTGGQPGVNALAATYYPTYLRSTGIGWGLGIGRLGAIAGPVVAGELIRLEWPARDLFLGAAVPALISAVVMFSLRWVIKPAAAPGAADRLRAVPAPR
jgi:MFS transporter, AAHS family, 4-hydroxybenzoate transporter